MTCATNNLDVFHAVPNRYRGGSRSGLQDATLMVEKKKAYGLEKEETKWNGKL